MCAVAGCVTVPVDTASVVAKEERRRHLLALNDWQLDGRIGLTSSREAISGDISWQQQGDDFSLSLAGPLGRGLAITQSQAGASLSVSGQGTVRGTNAENLLSGALGIPVPLEQMATWVKGLADDSTSPAYDRFGRLVQLGYTDASGVRWLARIRRYLQVDTSVFSDLDSVGVEQIDLPGLIEITGDDYEIRLLVKQWLSVTANGSADNQTPTDNAGSGRLTIPGG